MFTGIVTDIGEVLALEQRGDLRARISTRYDVEQIDLGASIACDGVCLTVVETGHSDISGWFEVDISAETIAASALGAWVAGRPVNLERALRVGDELGGHIVSGHVDGMAEIMEMRHEGDSTRVTLKAPELLAPFIAPKGSIALDGISLTVNEVNGPDFGVNLIPHTKQVTTWGKLAVGQVVNIEIDTLARYVARLREWSKP